MRMPAKSRTKRVVEGPRMPIRMRQVVVPGPCFSDGAGNYVHSNCRCGALNYM